MCNLPSRSGQWKAHTSHIGARQAHQSRPLPCAAASLSPLSRACYIVRMTTASEMCDAIDSLMRPWPDAVSPGLPMHRAAYLPCTPRRHTDTWFRLPYHACGHHFP